MTRTGPPWILGHRGTPRDAPENTLSSLQNAVALGLDGFEYDVRAAKSGELCLLHDETLDRTTDASGPLAARTLRELFGVDAGGWFGPRFAGEPVPLVSEALDVPGRGPGAWPMHMIELKEDGLVGELARLLEQRPRPLEVRVASFSLRACREARDLGLAAMLLAESATEELRELVRREDLGAVGLSARGWETPAGQGEWRGERWAWAVDEPADLLAACRRPLAGFNTNEPGRALAARALTRLAPEWRGPWPVTAPDLVVTPSSALPGRATWCGRWPIRAALRNPFAYPLRAEARLRVRGGAFEVSGLPAELELEPGQERELEFELTGGSWSPGGDPRLEVALRWSGGPGRRAGALVVDDTLHRVRELRLGDDARRVGLLREHPGQPDASMTVRRRGGVVSVAVEAAGDASDARAVLRLGNAVVRGSGRSVRARLPDEAPGGRVPFSCGFWGRSRGRSALRRWAGGLGDGPRSGAPGWLIL